MEKELKYKTEKCDHCGQTKTYLLGIDRGTIGIVMAIAKAIEAKGVNIVHPRKEGVLTTTQWCNIARPRFHGLIASVKGEPGNFCLTSKGARFLRGESVPRYAIVSKAEGHQIGYYEPENEKASVRDFLGDFPFWEGINYEIVEGRVVRDIGQKVQTLL